jgi:hypothetical protein
MAPGGAECRRLLFCAQPGNSRLGIRRASAAQCPAQSCISHSQELFVRPPLKLWHAICQYPDEETGISRKTRPARGGDQHTAMLRRHSVQPTTAPWAGLGQHAATLVQSAVRRPHASAARRQCERVSGSASSASFSRPCRFRIEKGGSLRKVFEALPHRRDARDDGSGARRGWDNQ